MTPNNLEINDDILYSSLYDSIYSNIEVIIEKYDDILCPNHNNTTLNYIKNGYNIKEAYTMSFMFTLLLYMNI